MNPLAGLHPQHSDLPIMASMVGMDYLSLVGGIMNSARARCRTGVRADRLAA